MTLYNMIWESKAEFLLNRNPFPSCDGAGGGGGVSGDGGPA